MTPVEILCPECRQADLVEKVSTIYLTGIGLRKLPNAPGAQGRPPNPNLDIANLSKRLAPPASANKLPLRPIHPDMVVIAFSAIVPIFAYGIFTTQPGLFIPMLVVLVCFYVFYVWQRKNLVAKFERQQAERDAITVRIQRGIDRWIKLYYCGREDGVFEPGADQLIPAGQMPAYLLHDK